MTNPILKIENVSKQYRLGTIGTGTIAHDLNRWWHAIRGKEDPYLKIGEVNDRSSKGNSDYVWALRDISFEVQPGEVVGIIGKNGAGKSTLLKILSRVTTPTTGSIKSRGRIASLLEVGTGFNPELTGRENIYLNGAILGMTKKEITAKLDEIIDFSGCERYIDTPTKRYSSGMNVRLGFAVAAFLEPEILVVDEVLAVGDAEFQKKAIGKMQDVSKSEGRTVLFVSHNMAAVRSLCTRGILLENGELKKEGDVEDIIKIYNLDGHDVVSERVWSLDTAPGNDKAKIISVKVISEDNLIFIEDNFYLEIVFENLIDGQKLNVSISIYDENENYLIASPNEDRKVYKKGKFKSTCCLSKNIFNTGKLFFSVLLIGDNFEQLAYIEKIVSVELHEKGDNRVGFFGKWSGLVRPYFKWNSESCNQYEKSF